jgi:hypothetical protein
MLRSLRWLFVVLPVLVPPGASRAQDPLGFEEALARRRATAGEAEVAALLAEARRAAAGGSSLAAEGPSLSVTGGPRRGDSGATAADVGVEVELPLLAARGTRAELAREIETAGADALAGARALAAAELAVSFVDAWLAQEAVAVREDDLAATEEWLAVARRRLEAGADPPYEPVLVAGERDRALVELVAARREAELAWGELAARSEVGAEARRLSLSGLPAAAPPPDSSAPPALTGIAARRRLAVALALARRAASDSRWAVASEIGAEGDERLVHFGVAYRFPLPGERAAIATELAAAEEGAARAAEADAAAVRARITAARSTLAAAGPALGPEHLEQARRALAARVAEGKQRPSEVLPLRRQLLEARLASLAAEALRARAAAELAFLTGGLADAP